MQFVLLMGIPRSGTTLAAALLDEMPDTVCLSEPLDHLDLMARSHDASEFASLLLQSLQETRVRLISGQPVFDSRAHDGGPITNYFSKPDDLGRRKPVFIIPGRTKTLTSRDVLVCSKHNALYTAILPELIATKQFRIIALVRDPTAVLASWRSLELPVSAGKLPAAERYWSDMRILTAKDIPLLTKHILMYELHCRRYVANQQYLTLLKYEDLLIDPLRLARAANHPKWECLREVWSHRIRPQAVPDQPDLTSAIRRAVADGSAPTLAKLYPAYKN